MEQSYVTDTTAEGLSESIVTGNSIPSVQNSRLTQEEFVTPLTGTNLVINVIVHACNLICLV